MANVRPSRVCVGLERKDAPIAPVIEAVGAWRARVVNSTRRGWIEVM